MDWIMDWVKRHEEAIIADRRHFHRQPELGFHEVQTSEDIAKRLTELGLEVRRGFGEAATGVMGILRGDGDKVLALRADIDALAITEENDLAFRSQNEGLMHACGHDGHIAMLLAAAAMLAEHRERVHGTVKFIFQPAEEGPYPGGASYVVSSGALDDVDAAFAMHLAPSLPVGTADVHYGAGTASADMFRMTVIGRGGHGSEPAKAIDPIVMAAQVVTACQSIVSRSIDARDASVLSICTISGGNAGNAIPERVTMTGTLRNFSEDVRNVVVERMEAVLKGVAEMNGGSYEFVVDRGYPALINNEAMSALAEKTLTAMLGAEHVNVLYRPIMSGEDFAYFARKVPSVMPWLGCGVPEKERRMPLHNPGYTMDERSLAYGAALHAKMAIEFFGGD